jgi:hypothetical protein
VASRLSWLGSVQMPSESGRRSTRRIEQTEIDAFIARVPGDRREHPRRRPVTLCRTLEEVRAAAHADVAGDPPLTQEQADFIAAILWPYRHQLAMFRGRDRLLSR